jgi:UDP-N-acetylglucosamine 3-dehydrogenase
MDTVRIGLYGAGGIAEVHAEGIAQIPAAKLVAVYDIAPERAKKLADKYGAQVCQDVQSLLADATIDAIDICLPTYLHAEAMIAAAQAGKHVLCEKPVALNVADVDRVIQVVEKAGVQAMIAQVVRFMPYYQLIKDLYDKGTLGRPLTAQLQRLAPVSGWFQGWFCDPKLSGGAVLDLHIHDLDFIYSLFGRPKQVYALGLKSQLDAWDQVLTTLDYGDFKASAEASVMFPASWSWIASIRLLGDKGCAQYPAQVLRSGAQVTPAATDGDVMVCGADKVPTYPGYVRNNPYQAEIEYFVECLIRGEAVQIANLHQAREVLEIAMAAKQSLETGQTVSM